MIMVHNWRERSSEIIAINFQRIFRGWKVRQHLLLLNWIEMNKAAIILQKAFRYFKNKMDNKYIIDTYLYQINQQKLSNTTTTNNKIERIFNNQSTHDETMDFWRSILELRRAYRKYNTDILIKAFVETNGDLQKSLTLLGIYYYIMYYIS